MSNNLNQGASIEAERRAIDQAQGLAARLTVAGYFDAALIVQELISLARRTPAATTGDGELLSLEHVIELIDDSSYEDPETGKGCFDRLGFARAVERAAIEADRAQLAQQGQGPVATVVEGRQIRFLANGKDFPKAGTLLYAAPASAQPADEMTADEARAALKAMPLDQAVSMVRGAQPDQWESANNDAEGEKA